MALNFDASDQSRQNLQFLTVRILELEQVSGPLPEPMPECLHPLGSQEFRGMRCLAYQGISQNRIKPDSSTKVCIADADDKTGKVIDTSHFCKGKHFKNCRTVSSGSVSIYRTSLVIRHIIFLPKQSHISRSVLKDGSRSGIV